MKTVRLAILALFVCAITGANAQYALKTGKMQFNGGLGLNQSTFGVPLYAGIDYGFDKNISVGGELSVRSFVNNDSYSSIIGLVANANYHFVELLGIEDVYDAYAGVDLGFYSGLNVISVGGHLGGRYYFKKNMAINLELGGGVAFSSGKIGLSILLNQD